MLVIDVKSFPLLMILMTPDALNQLEDFQKQLKFTEEGFYPGAPTEEIRVRCEQQVNVYLQEVIHLLMNGCERKALFERARTLCKAFDDEDTEERDKVGEYIGEVMIIIGLMIGPTTSDPVP
jgi:hypothetical protein